MIEKIAPVNSLGMALSQIDQLLIKNAVTEFLFAEAAVIDSRDFEGWLRFFSEDVRYWAPVRKNVSFKQRFNDVSGDMDTAWFDDDKGLLRTRVAQIMTGVHWAEEPLSRVSHLITNIVVDTNGFEDREGDELSVGCKILVHRARMDTESDILIGRREDRLRRVGSTFEICFRKIILDDTTLRAKNLSFFL